MRAKTSRVVLTMATVAVAAAISPTAAPAAQITIRNPGTINIPALGKADPYPSSIEVQGAQGRITDVSVVINRFRHVRPTDVDILLQAPNGKTSVVMSDVCGFDPLDGFGWAFERTAPTMKSGKCGGLFYSPTNDIGGDGADVWPLPPHQFHAQSADFDNFIGGKPNGVWKLWVLDDDSGGLNLGGQIVNGWALAITTEPASIVTHPDGGADGKADPYPAVRTVAGQDGVIEDIDVSVGGVYHQAPSDLGLLLVGPEGQKVSLMDGQCLFDDTVRAARWRWDDEAAGPMPIEGCASGSYRPADNRPDYGLPAPAPEGPYDVALSAFDGTNPNGEWRLYVNDYDPAIPRQLTKDGLITEPFELHVKTRPKSAVAIDPASVTIAEGEAREVSVTRAGDGLGAGSVRVTAAPGTATDGSDYTALSTVVRFAPGERSKQVPVSVLADADREESESFTLGLSDPTGDARIESAIATVTIPADPPPAGEGPGGGNAPGGGGEGPGGEGPGSGGNPDHSGGGPGPAARDLLAPRLTQLGVTNRRFRVRRKGTTRLPVGTAFRFTLDEPAAVTIAIERAGRGRRAGRRCVATSRRVPRRRRCTRYTRAGTLTRQGRGGPNLVRFTGRVGSRVLRPGTYRAQLTAADAAGNRSSPATIRFVVAAERR